MRIGGLQKLTLIDYPGKLACTVFLSGCNFYCPWCYSPELVLPEKIRRQPVISEKDFFSFLKAKKGLLEGVVICGGEPCLNKDLEKFVKNIKKLGFAVKLDTNGSNAAALENLVNKKLIDYVAMDIKAPKEKYGKIFNKLADMGNIERSMEFLRDGKIDCEFRTTVVPTILDKKDIVEISRWIKGAKKYYLQNFRPEKTLDPSFMDIKPYSEEYIMEIQKAIAPFFEVCRIR